MEILLRSREGFPAWSFANYVGGTAENYAKLLQIGRVVDDINQGARDDQFFVAGYSSELYPTSEMEEPAHVIALAEKGTSADEFWYHVTRLHRPVIFFRRSRLEPGLPLYVPGDPQALKIRQASLASPFSLHLEGLDKIIRELRFGGAEERRRQEQHELEVEQRRIEIERKRVQGMRELLTLTEEVERSRISPPFKDKIRGAIAEVTDRQNNLDDRATIEVLPNPKAKGSH